MSPEFWAIVGVGGILLIGLGFIERTLARKLDSIHNELFFLNREKRLRDMEDG